jgi:secreted trypsin-like serine protease
MQEVKKRILGGRQGNVGEQPDKIAEIITAAIS